MNPNLTTIDWTAVGVIASLIGAVISLAWNAVNTFVIDPRRRAADKREREIEAEAKRKEVAIRHRLSVLDQELEKLHDEYAKARARQKRINKDSSADPAEKSYANSCVMKILQDKRHLEHIKRYLAADLLKLLDGLPEDSYIHSNVKDWNKPLMPPD